MIPAGFAVDRRGERRRVRRPMFPACGLAAVLLLSASAGHAIVTIRAPEAAHSWPAGTDVIPYEFRDGLILVKATLYSRSGRDTSGYLIFDTGAPDLALTVGVWNALNVDTMEVSYGYAQRVRRPLRALEMSMARLTDLVVGGVVVDSILDPGVLGLFAPSVYEDRAVVVDYESRTLAVVPRRLTMVGGEGAAPGAGGSLARQTRVRSSKAQYAAVLGAAAAPLPFRRFKGGRMLVTAQAIEPASGWHSQPLTLLLDTGASSCVVFRDAMDERVRPPTRWPRRGDLPFRTVLGRFHEDATVMPRLVLTEATPPIGQDMVVAGVCARNSLPDIQGELPDPIHGLLGNTFLARFRVVLDYGNDVLWLEPRIGQVRPAGLSVGGFDVGVRLGQMWGELRVVEVAPGSPAQTAGIRAGDVVVSIDHAPAKGLDAEAGEERLRGGRGTDVVLVLRRDNLERVFSLKRRGGR